MAAVPALQVHFTPPTPVMGDKSRVAAASTFALYAIVRRPAGVPTVMLVTALPLIDEGEANPDEMFVGGSDPLELKYSVTAVLPEEASDKPSVTCARLV